MRSAHLIHQIICSTLILAVTGVLGILLLPRAIQAQSSPATTTRAATAAFELGVSPPTAYLRIQPGVSSLHTITLINTANTPVALTPEVVSFEPDGTSGNPRLLSELRFDYIDRNRTSFDPISIPGGGEYRFPLYLSIPGDAVKGEYPMTVLFRKQAAAEPGSPGVGGVIGSNLIVLISSDAIIPPQLSIESWQAARVVDSFGTISAAPILRNDSIGAQVASGSAVLLNPFGQEITEYTMSSDVVLGSSARQLRWTDPTSESTREKISHKGGFLLGPYTLRIEINTLIDESVQNQYFEYKIIALPISLIIAVIAAGGLILGYRMYAKKFTR